jgi:tRNA pseudouridine55 synthase
MDGIINVLKPPGMTSFDVVAYLRGVLKTKKIGHTGTLDPNAAGVLPVCIGSATKAVQYMTQWDKHYRAEAFLGVETDTSDSDGSVISSSGVNVTDEQIKSTLSSFTGEYSQLPPMYSAVRVKGKKLYEYARKGIKIDRKARQVLIHKINLVEIKRSYNVRVLFDVECSKGTYIRTLCEDIGKRLGCGAHMSFLLRKRTGPFDISTSLTIETIRCISENGTLHDVLVDTGYVFNHLRKLILDGLGCRRFLNGAAVKSDKCDYNKYAGYDRNTERIVTVYDENGRFLGLGRFVERNGICFLLSEKQFVKG